MYRVNVVYKDGLEESFSFETEALAKAYFDKVKNDPSVIDYKFIGNIR